MMLEIQKKVVQDWLDRMRGSAPGAEYVLGTMEDIAKKHSRWSFWRVAVEAKREYEEQGAQIRQHFRSQKSNVHSWSKKRA